MKFISLFEVIGPNMIGPSSSHTAGAVSIGLMAKKLFRKPVRKVTFTLYGSFSRTYRGHGTDRALLGGVLGFDTSDERIRDAFREAEQAGIEYGYVIDEKTEVSHPNTADILLEGDDGLRQMIRGESIGGGKIRITSIDGVEIDFTGEYSTLLIRHLDKPGLVAYITTALAAKEINIAFMKVFREESKEIAYTIVESDEPIPQEIVSHIKTNPDVEKVMLVQV